MARVVPTVLAGSPEEYQRRLERALSLSQRVHVDISDLQFTGAPTIGIAQVHVPEGTELDLHLMVTQPAEILETALSLHPRLVILHAESQGDLKGSLRHMRNLGVQAGIALLPETSVESAAELIAECDHVLVFTGTLGHNGGEFKPDQLAKVDDVRVIKPQVEISVDGGVSDKEAALISLKDVNVLYVGSFLQEAEDPQAAMESINQQAGLQA